MSWTCDHCKEISSHIRPVKAIVAGFTPKDWQIEEVNLCNECWDISVNILFEILPGHVGRQWIDRVRLGKV